MLTAVVSRFAVASFRTRTMVRHDSRRLTAPARAGGDLGPWRVRGTPLPLIDCRYQPPPARDMPYCSTAPSLPPPPGSPRNAGGRHGSAQFDVTGNWTQRIWLSYKYSFENFDKSCRFGFAVGFGRGKLFLTKPESIKFSRFRAEGGARLCRV